MAFVCRKLTVFVCVASLLLCQVTCSARSAYQLSSRDRQELIQLSARLLKMALYSPSVPSEVIASSKRNAGMLDTVINMPDLMAAGKKRRK